MVKNIDLLKFPVGKFKEPAIIDESHIKNWIKIIKDFPHQLKQETSNLSENELEKTYRPDGWTIRQLVNHCADSHMNSLIRFKLALTENTPIIKAYHEDLWAEMSDSKFFPIQSSIKILEGVHERWVNLLENLTEKEMNMSYIHPDSKEVISIKTNIGIYAWHCEHHLNHIVIAKKMKF